MPLPQGQRLGRFELLAPLGAGGMGVVYRARDPRLNRDVALKILSDELASNPEAIRRFEREARAASALNHPNIVTVFDSGIEDGTPFLVTELLEGISLAHRLQLRALPLAEALDISIQIAAALRAAHDAGIVHRDVKPQNVFLTRNHIVKLVDFGIARLVATDAERVSGADTGEASQTREGVTLGTVGYMAPEQIRGHAVDGRTDLFAFGCLLFEMLSGRPPFARATSVDTTAAVLAEPAPPLTTEQPLPPMLIHIVQRCLEKEPSNRFQSAADLQFALESLRGFAEQPPLAPPSPQSRVVLPLALTALAAVAAVLYLLTGRSAPADGEETSPRASTIVHASARPIAPAISPDGSWVSYISLADGSPSLRVQFLNGGTAMTLSRDVDMPLQNRTIVGGLDVTPDGSGITVAGRPMPSGLWQVPGIWNIPAPSGGPARRLTDRYAMLRWSPNGQRIAGVIANPLLGDAIAVADADGQNERVIVPAGGGLHFHHVAWSHDGRHVYYSRTLEPNHTLGEIYRAPIDGGAAEAVVRTAGTAMFPAPTPDGRALIYAGEREGEGLNIWWHPLTGGAARRLTVGAGEFTEPYLSRDGRHLVALARRRRGDLARVDLRVSPPVLASIAATPGDTEPAVAVSGDRAFVTSRRSGRRRIWSIGLDGSQATPLTAGQDDERRPSVSPDGRWVAFVSSRDGRQGVSIIDAQGGVPRRLVEAEVIDYVSWSPTGDRIAYATAGTGAAEIWITDVSSGTSSPMKGVSGRVPAWSPRADELAVADLLDGKPVVRFFAPDGAATREPISIDPVSLPTAMAWSRDGARLAMVNLPGRAAAEAWVLNVDTRMLDKVAELAAPAEFDGVSWMPDGQSLIVGRTEFETEVLLIQGLPGSGDRR